MATLTVSPKIALADSPVWIHVSGLEPSLLVTLCAFLVDEKGVTFSSRAYYRANAAGEVDLKQASALGGDYRGVWPMGLLCTLKSEEPLYQRLMKRDVMGSPFHVQINLLDSFVLEPSPNTETLATCTLERWYVAPGVERFPIKTGRVRGALFLPPGNGPFPGLIDMFGGSGGLFEFRASLLASKGYAVLALAFFAYEDLQKTLEEVDLEYFEEASTLLLEHPKVRGPKLGVIGLSKGAEVALAMGTFLGQIAAVVCINGSTAMQGAPLRFRDIYIHAFPYQAEKTLITNVGSLNSSYVMTDPQDEDYQNCAIPLERAEAHVLFVVGEDDLAVQSKVFAEAAIARARKHGNNKVTLLSYPGAGHLIEHPGAPLSYMSYLRFCRRPNTWGGQAEAHAKAQEDFWEEIQKFFELHLSATAKSSL